MTRKILMLFLLFMTISVFGQQRDGKGIEKLFKGMSDVEALQNGIAFQEGNITKTFLLSEATPDLNNIEKKLLNEYKQVAFMCNIASKPFYCYFVKDNEDKRGIVGLDGNVIVPPLSGNICNIPNGKDFGILLVGELSRPSAHELLLDWGKAHKDFNILGLFSAIIVNADKPTLKSLLPMNEYVFLSLGSRGNGKFDIFTMKIVDDTPLWGVVDMKGKEILPNKYTGFIRKGHLLDTGNTGLWGKWVGTTEMDMTEALNYSRDLKADTQRRRGELATALNSFGETMISTAEVIETVQNSSMDGSSSNSDANISGDLPTQYKKWASLAERHYNSITNLGLKGKDEKNGKDVGGTAGQGMSSSNYTQMKKSLREAQDEMRRIRRKANKQGVNIAKSEYEDIQIKY